MSPDAQRMAIAVACGWKPQKEMWPTGERIGWHPPGWDRIGGLHSPPDYLNDLNAMHEAETICLIASLSSPENDYMPECEQIAIRIDSYRKQFLMGLSYGFQATAAHKAEWLLKAMNLWDDSK